MDLCRKTEVEPYICLNLGTGTIDEAMQWVEYCNLDGDTEYARLRKQHGHVKPFNVKYWGLGNEVYGPWQMNTMDATSYGKIALQYTKAIKWVDPGVKIVAVAVQHTDWQTELLRQIRDPIIVGNSRVPCVDYVSIHAYFVSEPVSFYETMLAADHVEEQTQLLRSAIHAAYGSRDHQPLIAWDEWNFYLWSHYERAGENYRNEVYDLKNALFTASVLNSFIRNCDIVGMANYSPFVNIRGAIFADGPAFLLRPQYHVFDLYANHAGQRAIETTVESDTFSVTAPLVSRVLLNSKPGKVLDAAATVNDDGKELFLSIVNRHESKAIPCAIDLGDARVSNQATIFSINAASPTDSNSLNAADRVTLKQSTASLGSPSLTHTLPAHSVTAFLFKME
jgi:alpha-N-arabinofuranosidase